MGLTLGQRFIFSYSELLVPRRCQSGGLVRNLSKVCCQFIVTQATVSMMCWIFEFLHGVYPVLPSVAGAGTTTLTPLIFHVFSIISIRFLYSVSSIEQVQTSCLSSVYCPIDQ